MQPEAKPTKSETMILDSYSQRWSRTKNMEIKGGKKVEITDQGTGLHYNVAIWQHFQSRENKRKGHGTSGMLHLWRIKCSLVIKAKCRQQDDLQASTKGIIYYEISENKCLFILPSCWLRQNSWTWLRNACKACLDSNRSSHLPCKATAQWISARRTIFRFSERNNGESQRC